MADSEGTKDAPVESKDVSTDDTGQTSSIPKAIFVVS